MEIIDPKQPTFNDLLASNKPGAVTPFSVFVKNNNDQAIASCSLKWEIESPDGQITTQFLVRTGTLEVVTNGGEPRLSEAIPAKGNLIFSLSDSSNTTSLGPGSGFSTGGGADVSSQLSSSSRVTVSVDGVLFTDGTFVGPDAKRSFELLRGQIGANRELAAEIMEMADSGVTFTAILNHLNKISKLTSKEAGVIPGEDPRYSFGRWMQRRNCAHILVAISEKNGEQAMLDRVRSELAIPSMNLRRSKED